MKMQRRASNNNAEKALGVCMENGAFWEGVDDAAAAALRSVSKAFRAVVPVEMTDRQEAMVRLLVDGRLDEWTWWFVRLGLRSSVVEAMADGWMTEEERRVSRAEARKRWGEEAERLIVEKVARSGALASLAFLHEVCGLAVGDMHCAAAAASGQVECLKYAHTRAVAAGDRPSVGYWSVRAVQNAAFHGHLECLEYLHEVGGYAWDETCARTAAMNGHLECLKYLHEHGCPWDKDGCMRAAAIGGHLECLKYSHEVPGAVGGYAWKVCIQYAVRNGHLECLKYLHAESGMECPWDRVECELAAWGGHYACLVYLHEHGCPWDAEACVLAVEEGGEYAFKYGPQTAKADYLKCLKYLEVQRKSS